MVFVSMILSCCWLLVDAVIVIVNLKFILTFIGTVGILYPPVFLLHTTINALKIASVTKNQVK